ncbi:MAG: hypothetical protein COW30_05910 [Rhodospirillales bacterium CG15_BIG_FIL_POST_REV_8_21_14_020_66_15]|nr:MAG: hypothetical protein COW30_05910 [Rhodospirillales bacterium CG15_BIG_FIL_POST_REV_8_21_14_020_66_15]
MGPFSRHALYRLCCQQAYKVQGGTVPDGQTDLAETGFTTLDGVLRQESVRKIRDMIDRMISREPPPFSPTPEIPAYFLPWQDEDKKLAADILTEAISGRLETLLHQYFQSHFFIRTVTASRLFPSDESMNSYLWHRDSEIPHQVHVIIYLTELSAEHGSTELLSLEDTKAAAAAGYDFPYLEDRESDLGELFKSVDKPYAPYRVSANAGDALIFTPNRVLHKGAQPNAGFRDAILAVVHPCPSPWRLTLQHNYPRIFVTMHGLNALTDPFAHFKPEWDHFGLPEWVREFKMAPPNWIDAARG